MKPLFLSAFVVMFCAVAASAMTPETAKFMRANGMNPESADAIAIDAEGPVTTNRSGDDEEFSLDILATAKKKNGLSAFIGSRTFIRNLKKNFAATQIPKTNYDPLYLTSAERSLVGKKFLESIK